MPKLMRSHRKPAGGCGRDCALLEPPRKPLVQLGATRFRQRLVRGVAEELVAECVFVISCRVDGVSADECVEVLVELEALVGRSEVTHAVAMELLALY